MKHLLYATIALVVLSSHDMYLRFADSYFLPPGSDVTVQLYNGTFDRSDNTIDRNRMADVSLLGHGKRTAVDTTQWRDEGNTTLLDFTTGQPGTYVAGVSTRARAIEMDATAFNDYLAHDGVVDMLDRREREGTMEDDAVEKYAKHVKTIFQVGEEKTDDWQTVLGYPIEFVPLANPYDLHPGDSLSVRLLYGGRPLAGQLVLIDSDRSSAPHTHDGGEAHTHAAATEVRTDADGKLTFQVSGEGSWFLRTIHMITSEEEGLTHESNWATLTFGVDHEHSHAGGAHDHAHEEGHAHDHEFGVPGYVLGLGSLLVLGGLFFYFNRQ